MNTLMLLLLIQGGILSLLLFTRKHNTLQNRLLGGFVATISGFYGIELLESFFQGISSGIWIFPFSFCKLILPAILFLYTKSLTTNEYSIPFKKISLNVIASLAFSSWSLLTIDNTSFDYFTNSIYGIILSGLIILFWCIYLPSSYSMIKIALKEKKIAHSYIALLRLLFLTIVISLVFEVIDDTNELLNILPKFDFFNFIDILFLILIYFISYKALSQPQIFQNLHLLLPKPETHKKYSSSTLTEERLMNIQNQLEELMQNEKIYLNGELSIQQVADKLNISRQYLTQVLNDKMKCNFNDYINSYRVEEFKKKAKYPQYSKFTILALALDSGFNSKTSFNTIFKKHTGITPSQFRKNIFDK